MAHPSSACRAVEFRRKRLNLLPLLGRSLGALAQCSHLLRKPADFVLCQLKFERSLIEFFRHLLKFVRMVGKLLVKCIDFALQRSIGKGNSPRRWIGRSWTAADGTRTEDKQGARYTKSG